MTVMIGADTERLSTLADDISGIRNKIMNVHNIASGGVATLEDAWVGPDAGEFRTRWSSHHSPGINSVLEHLDRIEHELARQSVDQNLTSAVLGPSLSGGPPATPPGHPVESWQIEIDASVKVAELYKVLDVNVTGEVDIELVRNSNGTFDVTLAGGTGAEIGLGPASAGRSSVNSVTFSFTEAELAYLEKNGLPLPGNAITGDVDTSQVELGDFSDNLSAMSFEQAVNIDLNGLDLLPVGFAQSDVFSQLDGALPTPKLPESLDASAEVAHGFEVRKDSAGNWEVASQFSIAGEAQFQTDHGSGGFLQSVGDFFSPVDHDKISIDGVSGSAEAEAVYNLGTGETYVRLTTETTTFEGHGSATGADVPVFDELLGTPSHDVFKEIDGTASTTTTERTMSLDGTEIDTSVTKSDGTFREFEVDLVSLNGGLTVSNEKYQAPVED